MSIRIGINDLIDIYHELLINDFSVMRGNYPATTLFRPGKNKFSYYINDFPMGSNTSRCLSPLLVVYSIVNALVRLTCGIEIPGPNSIASCLKTIDDECAEKVRKLMARYLGEVNDTDSNVLVEAIIKIIEHLEKNKLLHVIKRLASDNIWPDAFLYESIAKSPTNNSSPLELNIEDEGKLASLKAFSIIYRCLTKILRPNELYEIISRIDKRYGCSPICSNENECNCFKTAHGELVRLASNAGSLPLNKANYESLVLPFIMEPRISFEYADSNGNNDDIVSYVPITELKGILTDYGLNDKYIEILLEALQINRYNVLTKYQFELLRVMFRHNKPFISMLAAPTGSGKTLIFTIFILAKILKEKSVNRRAHALLIYPRKSLARDQLRRFIELLYTINNLLSNAGLSRSTISIGIRDGDSLTLGRLQNQRVMYDVFRDIELSVGKKICHGFSRDHRYEVFMVSRERDCNSVDNSEKEIIDWLIDTKNLSGIARDVDIIITNMHMITKIVNNLLAGRRNSFWENFIDRLKIMVIDEAHTYTDSRELTLASLTLSKLLFLVKKYNETRGIREGLQLDIILSSATMSNSEYFQKISSGSREGKLDSRNILGISLVPLCSENNNVSIPSELLSFTKILIGKNVFEQYDKNNSIIYRDYWTSLVCSGINTSRRRYKTSWRIILPAITFPIPTKRSNTSLLETWISVIHWIISLRQREQDNDNNESLKLSSIIFIDNKDTIHTVTRYISERQIIEAKDHADRVLLTPAYPGRRQAERQIGEILKSFINSTLFDVLWSVQFSDFQHLSLYLSYDEQKSIRIPKDIEAISNHPRINSIKDIIDDMINYANDVLRYRERGRALLEIINNFRNRKYRYLYYLWHHADLDKKMRAMIEEELKNGNVITITSTSTLEVGVDVPNLSLVVQFGATTGTAELHQRFGRAGRNTRSMFVSLGMLVLRNTGQDIHLLLEDNAIDYVYNLFIPALRDPRDDINLVLQQLSPIAISTSISRTLEELVGFINDKHKDKIIEELIKIKELFEKSKDLINRSILNIAITHRDLRTKLDSIKIELKNSKENCQKLQESPIINEKYKEICNLMNLLMGLSDKLRGEFIVSLFNCYVILFDKMLRELRELRRLLIRQYGLNNTNVKSIDNIIYRLESAYNEILKLFYYLTLRSLIDIASKLGVPASNMESFINSFIRNQIYPRISTDIGTFDDKYLLIRFLDFTDISHSYLSFDSLVRRILPLKRE